MFENHFWTSKERERAKRKSLIANVLVVLPRRPAKVVMRDCAAMRLAGQLIAGLDLRRERFGIR